MRWCDPFSIDSELRDNRRGEVDLLSTPQAALSDAKSGLTLVPDLQAVGALDQAQHAWR